MKSLIFMSADLTAAELFKDKMRLFWRRPSLRLLVIPLLLLAFLSFITLLTDWVDWTPNRTCVSMSVANSSLGLTDRKTFDWWVASEKAYKRSLNEPSFAGTCHQVDASKADFDTMDIYPTLNFQVSTLHPNWQAATCTSSYR